jgi:hypothetical protein
MFMFFQVISEVVSEIVFVQAKLPFNIQPDCFFIDSPIHEFAVFLFCLASVRAELFKNPIRGEAGVVFVPRF